MSIRCSGNTVATSALSTSSGLRSACRLATGPSPSLLMRAKVLHEEH